jgi:peptide/nickel transport system substrate-binding protein
MGAGARVAAGLAFGLALMPVSAWAAGKCINVAGYEAFGEKETMDPAHIGGTDDSYHIEAIYEGLVDLDNNYQAVPRLAESWESNADGSVWTFHLRKGVKFHNGQEFGAKDVVYTFQRLLDPATASGAQPQLAAIMDPKGIEAVDDHTVQFKLLKPVVDFPVQERTKFSLIVPNGAKGDDLRLHGVGTGPFAQEVFTPGGPERILRRNPSYWAAGLPKADCLRIVSITEPVARMTSLLSGDTDLLLSVDPSTLTVLKGNPKATLVMTQGAMPQTISVWVDTPPYNNPKVLEAMKLVVDRQKMADLVALGYAEPGNDAPVVPSSPWSFSKEVPKRDVAKAKQLLSEAGYPNGLDIDVYTAEVFPGMLNFGQVYAQMAADAGIKIHLIRVPDDTFWTDTWLKKPALTSSWGARGPSEALSLAYRKGAPWNETHWSSDAYDKLLDEANAQLDEGKRKALLQQAQKMLADKGGVIIPYFSQIVSALRAGCTGFQPNVQVSLIDYRNVTCE